MKNYFKFYSLLIISLILIGCNNMEQPNVFGYESEDGNKVDITTGDQASLDVIVNYFEGYNNKDLETIFSNISNFFISSSNSCFTLILISHSPIMSECLISFCEKEIETINIKK